MASPVAGRPPYTTTSLSDDDLQHDSDSFINDRFPVDEDDDDLSIGSLEENDDGPPSYYAGSALCVVSSRIQ